MRARAQAGLDWMRANPTIDMTRIATVGYCFGGTVVFEMLATPARRWSDGFHPRLVPRSHAGGREKNINGRVSSY